jgi:formylglycine-generating enzyme required for sulfatase activity
MLKIALLPALPVLVLTPVSAQQQPATPVLGISNLIEGSTTTVEVSNCSPGDLVSVGASLHGGGPTTTPYGIVDLTQPWMQSPNLTADAAGIATVQKPVPPGSAGMPVWLHALNYTTGDLSNSLAVAIAAAPPPVDILFVNGGSFSMGDHFAAGGAEELPQHTVRLDGMWMDKYEVTHESYVAYLNYAYDFGEVFVSSDSVYQVGGAGQKLCVLPPTNPDSFITWNGSDFGVVAGKEQHPVAMVTWFGACTYANWRSMLVGRAPCYDMTTFDCDFDADGCRLPTEAEFEYAMRGAPPVVHQYPWGDLFDGSHANYFNSGDPFEPTGSTPVGYYDGGQVPPGVDMANGFGLYDMAGNAYEWCNDWYDAAYYAYSPSANPTGPATGTMRVMRGGACNSGSYYIRNACRGYNTPQVHNPGVGFRVVQVHP